jgi:tetratricopeptide (TPR) repeat protein
MYMRPSNSEFQSRAAATLSNLAVLARQSEDFQRCRELANEALGWQKHALELEPVYEHAHDFLRRHYYELARALSALKEREALAALSEERVTYSPDSFEEYCEAAICFGDCLEQLHADTQYQGTDRQQLMDGYARRAFALLDTATDFAKDNRAVFTAARAFVELGDACAEMQRNDDASLAWQSAKREFVRVQDAVAPKDKWEFDEYIASTQERLQSLEGKSVTP